MGNTHRLAISPRYVKSSSAGIARVMAGRKSARAANASYVICGECQSSLLCVGTDVTTTVTKHGKTLEMESARCELRGNVSVWRDASLQIQLRSRHLPQLAIAIGMGRVAFLGQPDGLRLAAPLVGFASAAAPVPASPSPLPSLAAPCIAHTLPCPSHFRLSALFLSTHRHREILGRRGPSEGLERAQVCVSVVSVGLL